MFTIFSVGIKDLGDLVQITGISYYDLSKDIEKHYNTSLITKHQIKRESWDTVKLQKFYLLELYNCLISLLKIKNLRVNRRKANELKELIETDTWVKDTLNMSGTPLNMDRLKNFRKTPFPKQMEFLEQYPIITHSYHLRGVLLDGKAGSGKAMPLSTKVKVPGGWKRLGDLKEGDPVTTPDGRIAKVVGIYPQGVTDVYRFTFEDGRTADSHPGHLWEVDEIGLEGDTEITSPGRLTTTADIVKHFDQFTYKIPLVGELGGDSESTESDIRHGANAILNGGIDIPDGVLELSYRDRFELAKAMMEFTPVEISANGLSFFHVKEQGANNFKKLIWSLGGIASEPIPGQGVYKVVFKHRDVEGLIEELVGHATPAVKKRFNTKQYRGLKLKIVSYEERAPEETVCISIDSDKSLYIVDDYIVTHNTFTSIALNYLINDAPTVVLCPMSIVNKVWVNGLNEDCKKPVKIWTSLMGSLPTEGYDYYIIHYDYMTSGAGEYLQRFLKSLSLKHKGALKLTIDECHNFNDYKSARSRKLVEWGDANIFAFILPMSGTVLKAMGSEIYVVLCLLDKFFNKQVRQSFLDSYGRNRPAMTELLALRIGRTKFTIPDLVGIPDAPPIELVKVKIPNGDRFTLEAIKLQMQLYISERIAFYNKHMAEFLAFYNDVILSYELDIRKDPKAMERLERYKTIVHRFRTQGYSSFTDSQDSVFCKEVEADIEKDLRGPALKQFRNVKSAIKYLGLKLRGEALGNILGRARIEAVKAVIEHAGIPDMINSVEKKTLIFTSYVESMELCDAYLRDNGFAPVTVYGENSKDRDGNINAFRDNPNINPLIAVMNSLKEGYPLTMANLTILLDAPYREYELKQIVARTVRVGQDAPCFFKLLDLDTGDKLNITTRSINIMEWSKEQVDSLLMKENTQAIFASVSGNEMLDVSYEGFTLPIVRPKAKPVYSIFD